MKKRWIWILGILLVFIGLPAFLAWNFFLAPVLELNARYRALIGKTEAQVVADLGPPKFRVSPEEARQNGIDYHWREMKYQPVPDRVIHKAVLLFEPHGRSADTTPFAVYIFVGDDGRV